MRLTFALAIVVSVAVQAQEYNRKIDLLKDARRVETTQEGSDGRMTKVNSVVSRRTFEPPFRITYVLNADKKGLCLVYGAMPVVFNWSVKKLLRPPDGGPATPVQVDGGRLAANEYVTIVHEVTPTRTTISVDGVERGSLDVDNSNVVAPAHLFYEGPNIAFRSIQAESVESDRGPVRSLGLGVTLLASGGSNRTSKSTGSVPNYVGTGTGTSYDQEKIRKSQTVLNVHVSNLGSAKATPQLECVFFAGDVKAGKMFILNRENQRITVDPAKTERFELKSAEASSRITRQLAIATNASGASLLREGIAIKGWFVRLIADGQVYAVRASAPSYEALARDEGALMQVPVERPERL